MQRKRFTTALACISLGTLMLGAVPEAFADTPATASAATEETYDLSVPGSILMYKSEVSQGGLDLATGKMTTDASLADIAFDNGGGTIGARGVIDEGSITFNSVHSLPDYSYDVEKSATQGHVYLVQTHDNRVAELLIESITNGQVDLKVAYLKPQPGSSKTSSASGTTGGKSTTGSKTTTHGKTTVGKTTKTSGTTTKKTTPAKHKAPAINISRFLNHTWKLIIPSSTSTTTDNATNTETTTSSLGANAGTLRLNSNGTYVWYDPISGNLKGHWIRQSSTEYPILLLKGANDEDWQLGPSSRKSGGGKLLIWDGNTWEIGF